MTTEFESIHQWFEQTAERFADQPAVNCAGESYTYEAVKRRSDVIADNLLERELPAGSLVGLLCDRPFEFVCSVLGTLKAGLAFVPLDGRLPAPRLRLLLSVAEPSLFLVERELLDVVPENSLVLCLDEVAAIENGKPRPVVDPDGRCYIYFTSGSTGRPKAIAGRLKGIDHFIRWEAEALQVQPGMRMSQLLAPTFDGSLREIFLPLCTGGVMVAPPDRRLVQDATALATWLKDERIELLHCVPSLLRSLCGTSERFDDLKWVVMAGEALQPGDVARWKERGAARLVNLYGTSETTMAKFCYLVADEDDQRRAIPVGKPIPGTHAFIADAQGKPCPKGIAGEIYIATPYRSLGYYNDEEQTRAAFVVNPLTKDPNDLVHRTGDLGRVTSDGNFEYLGRRDQQVKVRGIRVELGEVEDALRALAGVSDAVVIERTDASGNNYLCGYVACANGTEVSATEARRQLLAELPDYMVPSAVVVLEELPRTISGKVDKRALPAPGAVRGGLGEYIAPRTPVETSLCGIWSEVLKVEKVGVRDNFFELGGHSLLATQVMSRIREAHGVEMPLVKLFELPTVEGLAAATIQMQTVQTDSSDLARLLEEIKDLSEEDLDTILATETV